MNNRINENINNAPAELNPINTHFITWMLMNNFCLLLATTHQILFDTHRVYSSFFSLSRVELIFCVDTYRFFFLSFFFIWEKVESTKICCEFIYYSSRAMVLIEELFNVMAKYEVRWNYYSNTEIASCLVLSTTNQVAFFPGTNIQHSMCNVYAWQTHFQYIGCR